MNKLVFIVSISLMGVMLTAAGTGGQSGKTREFSNDDLLKYKKLSHTRSAPETGKEYPPERIEALPADEQVNTDPEKKGKKYVISYKGTARRIIIPVTFNRRTTVPMLLDTGAPGMLISTGLAERLGMLDNDEGNLLTMTGGIGGSAPAIFTIVDSIQVGQVEDTFIPTTISAMNGFGFEGLIGMDFMGKYSMQVDNRKRVLILEELLQSPLRPGGHDELWWRTTFGNFKSMRDGWEQYREHYRHAGTYTTRMKEIKNFIEKQCSRADFLYNRLNVYASEHSVPREWR